MGLRNETDGGVETILLPSDFSPLLYCFSQVEDVMSNLKFELSSLEQNHHSLSPRGKVLLWHIF